MVSKEDIPDQDTAPWDRSLTIGDVLECESFQQFQGAVAIIEDVDGLAAAIDYERAHQNRGAVLHQLRTRAHTLLAKAGEPTPEGALRERTATTPESAAALRDAADDSTEDGSAASHHPGVAGASNGGITSGTTAATTDQ